MDSSDFGTHLSVDIDVGAHGRMGVVDRGQWWAVHPARVRVFVSILSFRRVDCLAVGGKYRECPGLSIIFTTVSLRSFLRDFLFASLLFHGAGAGPDDTGPTVIEEGVHVRVRSASVARQPFFYSSFLQPVFARNGTGLTHVTAGQVPPGACSFDPHDGVRGACRAVISRGSWLSFEKGRGRWPTAPTAGRSLGRERPPRSPTRQTCRWTRLVSTHAGTDSPGIASYRGAAGIGQGSKF
jgi:hypothetical protein